MSRKGALDLNPAPESPTISLLCFNLSGLSKNVQFIVCTVAVFVFYVLYGVLQEAIFTVEGFQPYGWFLTLVQFGFYSIFGLVECKLRGITSKKIPLQTYFLLALLTLGTMGLSNASLGYLNYPTQVIFKCCKLIPVLVGGILIQGKKYGALDFFAASLMCIGLILFTLADSLVQPNFNLKGILMISLALLCDASIGNVQEKSMKKYGAPNAEVVLYSYSLGFVYIFAIMLCTGGLFEGIAFFGQSPRKLYGLALIFSLTGYLGIQVVLTLVRTTGAFSAVTVTTCRKAVTIVISFLFFSKPFTFQYLWSGLLVILGIYLNLFSKIHPDILTKLLEQSNSLARSTISRLSVRKYQHKNILSNV